MNLKPIFPPKEGINQTNYYWFEKGFVLPDNFEISQGKITFIYNPYEVSNYANGVITFSMPLRQIKPYLKREI